MNLSVTEINFKLKNQPCISIGDSHPVEIAYVEEATENTNIYIYTVYTLHIYTNIEDKAKVEDRSARSLRQRQSRKLEF